MLVRILALASLVLALSAPVALGADGTPQPPAQGSAAPAAAGRHGGAGKLEQRLAELRQKLERAGGAFAKRCASGKADTAKCTAAAKKLLDALQRVDGRIDRAIANVEQRCATGASQQAGPAPKACAHAQQVTELLQNVQAKVRQFAQKLQDWLAQTPTPAANGTSSAATQSTGSTLESLDELNADLAAARDAAAQSGL